MHLFARKYMDQKNHILIAGGSGLIGKRLTLLLKLEGYSVSYLSRSEDIKNGIKCFLWNPNEKSIDPAAFTGITHIVNLAGESIAGSHWTNVFKEKIINSRLDASATLLKELQSHTHNVKAIIGSSAIGIYGNRNEEKLTEENKTGNDFLSETVQKWEESYELFTIRKVIFRIGIVLSKNGGALVPMSAPIKFGIAPILGDGKQWMSWIHIDDVCRLIIHAIKNDEMHGVFNAVAPNPVTARSFILTLRSVINKISIPISVPEFFLKLIMGEQKAIVLNSVNASCEKLEKNGFIFTFSKLKNALKNIYE